MARGKKHEEIKTNNQRKNRVIERKLREGLQNLPPDKAPAEKKLIDKPKGDADGKKG